MNLPTDFCPLCNHKLHLEVEKEGYKVFTNYYCPRNSKIVSILDGIGVTRPTNVFHYTYRQFHDGCIVEIIIGSYLIKHCIPVNRTRIVYLPEGNVKPQFIVETPLLDLDYSKPQIIIDKIKRLVLLS